MTLTVGRVLATALALGVAAHVLGGVKLDPGLDPLTAIGTLLVVALLLEVLVRLATPVRRAVRLLSPTVVVGALGVVLVNAAVFWVCGFVARTVGLGFAVTGFAAALSGSLLLFLSWWIFAPR
jgi:uncharacterized membrane protein YvlD (DUF360 family)